MRKIDKAILILDSLKPRCTVADARCLAVSAGISRRTLARAYSLAGMKFKRTKTEDLLILKDL